MNEELFPREQAAKYRGRNRHAMFKVSLGGIHYCETCDRYFHSLGIARHRAAHRDRKEDCTIYGPGKISTYNYSEES